MSKKRVTPLSAAVDKQCYIKGLTRQTLADELGISYNYVSLILRGYYRPNIEITNRMAKILGMNSSELRELALKKVV